MYWKVMSEQRTLENPQPFHTAPTNDEINDLPNMGLYHTKQKMWDTYYDKDLKNKSNEFLAEFADYIVRGSLNQDWFKVMYNDIPLNIHPIMNMYNIGNMAYIALHTNDNKFKCTAHDMLKKWRHNPYANIKSYERTLDNPQPFGEPPEVEDIFVLPDLGCYQSIEELIQARNPTIVNKSPEFLSKYANYTGKGSFNQQWYMDMIMFERNYIRQHGLKIRHDITFIGNVSYVSIHNSSPICKSCADDILEMWRNKY